MCASELVQIIDLPPYLRSGSQTTTDGNHDNPQLSSLLETKTLTEANKKFEKLYITSKLQENDWNISKTAEQIGTTRRNLHRKINALDISSQT